MREEAETEGEIVRKAIQSISKKWHSQIIYALMEIEKASFKQIKDEIDGISNKVLSGSLKDLREKGMVVKDEEDESSEYRLSKKGREMEPMLEEALHWGEKYLSENEKFHILVVEDDESQATMYRRWLEDIHSVKTATSGSEALENLSDDTDIVFLDRKLPDMNASEILDAAGNTLKGKYVVMLTAAEPGMDVLELDIQEYLTKPVSRGELEEVLENIEEQGQKTEKTKKLWSLVTKKSLLEKRKREEELEEEKRYRSLRKEINRLKDEVNDIPEKIRDRI